MMPVMTPDRSLAAHCSTLEDPRCALKRRHLFSDIIAINLIYDAVKDLTKDELERRVRKNAAAKDFQKTSIWMME